MSFLESDFNSRDNCDDFHIISIKPTYVLYSISTYMSISAINLKKVLHYYFFCDKVARRFKD